MVVSEVEQEVIIGNNDRLFHLNDHNNDLLFLLTDFLESSHFEHTIIN